MNAAFITSGVLILTGTVGEGVMAPRWRGGLRRSGLVLMSSMGIGMIVCGTFTLNSMMLHLAGFVLAVPLPAIGLVLAGWSWRHDVRPARRLSWIGVIFGAATLVLFVVFQATFDASGAGGNTGFSGLIQRALIVTAMAGVSAVIVLGRTDPGDAPKPRTGATTDLAASESSWRR